MENEEIEQKKLFKEVLKRFQEKGILRSVVLIGSWCVPLYKKYFKELKNISTLRTRDMDFLVPLDSKFEENVNVVELLEDLGFTTEFFGSQGYIKLIHPYLFLEFLVPDKGRGSDKPYDLSCLGINAQRLRFVGLLTEETISVKIDDIEIIIPHPVMFALHKLLICERRTGPHKKSKALKDKLVAIQILHSMIMAKEIAPIKGIFRSFHKNRQKEIIKVLEREEEINILTLLKDE